MNGAARLGQSHGLAVGDSVDESDEGPVCLSHFDGV